MLGTLFVAALADNYKEPPKKKHPGRRGGSKKKIKDLKEKNYYGKGHRDSACYKVKVVFKWKEDCPLPDDAKETIAPLIGCTHKEKYPFLKVGEFASPGVESMAESGDPGLLAKEISGLIDYGTCHKQVGPYGPSPSPGHLEFEVTVTKNSPYVSFVGMLAPSPDWFTGLLNIDLRKENGKGWKKRGSYKLGRYDAGTEEGDE